MLKKFTFLTLLVLLISCKQIPETFTNPIIPGGHPDPSICRVGDTYYIANSSFVWFPGVPIHRSKDLVNWELISYALPTPKHVDINDRTGAHGGPWAPTIRYHDGVFYLTVTQRSCGSSILITATNPEGPWSEPITLHSQNGIDGSILFDEEHNWYCWSEDHLILLREYDNTNKTLIGDTILLLNEQMFGDDYSHIEGPHIYKLKSGEYMLLIASGGTGSNNHNVSVFKSDKPTGPYKPCPHNPVLTHRGTDSPFNNIGHADIVETQNGEWYAVTLGVRPLKGKTIMDRETFLKKFRWENGWPVFDGLIQEEDTLPNLPWTPVPEIPEKDKFDQENLALKWNFYHTPHETWWSLSENPGHLRIYLQEPKMNAQTNTPLIAQRITQFNFEASTKIKFKPQKGETAGLIALMNQKGQYRCEVYSVQNDTYVRLVRSHTPRQQPTSEIVIDSIKVGSNELVLKLTAEGLDYRFSVKDDDDETSLGGIVDGSYISRQMAGSYSGAYVGMFASSNENTSESYADFDWFEYETQN